MRKRRPPSRLKPFGRLSKSWQSLLALALGFCLAARWLTTLEESSLELTVDIETIARKNSPSINVKQNREIFSNASNASSFLSSQPWPLVSHRRWCRLDSQSSSTTSPGLIYVKIPKTSSSTLAGINIRIARAVGKREVSRQKNIWSGWTWSSISPRRSQPRCAHTYHHGRQPLLDRDGPTLLWTFLRNPAKRSLSEFFHFEVARKGKAATEAMQTVFLRYRKHYQFLYVADYPKPEELLPPSLQIGNSSPGVESSTNRDSMVNVMNRYVLQPYDFIGLVERREESLAVMKLLWGLRAEDLIVLSAKTSGGYDDGRYNGTCIRIPTPPTPLSPSVQGYIDQTSQEENYDNLLYALVEERLEATIEALGRARVTSEAQQIRAMQELATRQCQSHALFPCSAEGKVQWEASRKNCYALDSGCGFPCVDRTLDYDYS